MTLFPSLSAARPGGDVIRQAGAGASSTKPKTMKYAIAIILGINATLWLLVLVSYQQS